MSTTFIARAAGLSSTTRSLGVEHDDALVERLDDE